MPDLAAIRRALVISPHADDEALACGGTMARLGAQGTEVRVLYMTVVGFHHYGLDGATTYQDRVKEIEAVADLLRFEWEIVYGDQDLIEKLDTVPKRDLVDRFEREVAQYVGVPHAVATVNGTAAIHVALPTLRRPDAPRRTPDRAATLSRRHPRRRHPPRRRPTRLRFACSWYGTTFTTARSRIPRLHATT